jgi:hypothetical protein
MSLRKRYQWVKQTIKHWEGVSRHFRANVEVFSRGVVRAQSSHVRKIAGVSGGRADSQRRRLQRFLAAPQPINSFFQHWTRSVVETLKQRRIVLVVDETKLKATFGVMVVGQAGQGGLSSRHTGAGVSRPRHRHLAAADAGHHGAEVDVSVSGDQAEQNDPAQRGSGLLLRPGDRARSHLSRQWSSVQEIGVHSGACAGAVGTTRARLLGAGDQ